MAVCSMDGVELQGLADSLLDSLHAVSDEVVDAGDDAKLVLSKRAAGDAILETLRMFLAGDDGGAELN